MDSGRVRHLRQKQASAEDRLRPRCALNLLTDLVWVDVKTPSKTKSRKPHIAPSDTPPSSRTRLSSSNISTVSPTSTLESTRIDVSASDCSPACSHKLKRRQRNTGLLWNTCTCTCIRTTHRRCAMRVNIGYRPHQGTFKCTNGSCWVSEYQADLNAAANRVNRLNPWGKSLPWISASDDSPQSGGQRQIHQDTLPSEKLPSERRASSDKGSSSSPAAGARTEPETGNANTS